MKNILAASSKKLLAINMGIDWQYGNRILEWNNPPFKGNPLGIYMYSLFGCLCMLLSSADHFKARPDLVNCGRRDLRHFAESVEMIFGTFFRDF